jgi:hypothetical protein
MICAGRGLAHVARRVLAEGTTEAAMDAALRDLRHWLPAALVGGAAALAGFI